MYKPSLILCSSGTPARGGEKDFGKEAIDTLVKAMEDYRDNFILILAGYREEMKNFLQMNPGLRSRFPIHLDFPDYTLDELLEIAEQIISKRQYKLSLEGKKALSLLLASKADKIEGKMGNARMVRNLMERAIRRQAVRLVNKGEITREELMIITAEDLNEEVS